MVYVYPKKTVLDPQGTAVGNAMVHLGIKTDPQKVRVGKTIEFELESRPEKENHAVIDRLCQDLLSNPIIEDYHYEILEEEPGRGS